MSARYVKRRKNPANTAGVDYGSSSYSKSKVWKHPRKDEPTSPIT